MHLTADEDLRHHQEQLAKQVEALAAATQTNAVNATALKMKRGSEPLLVVGSTK